MTEKLSQLIDQPIVAASSDSDDEDRRYKAVTAILLKDPEILKIANIPGNHSPGLTLGILIYLENDEIKKKFRGISDSTINQLDTLVEKHMDEIKEYLS